MWALATHCRGSSDRLPTPVIATIEKKDNEKILAAEIVACEHGAWDSLHVHGGANLVWHGASLVNRRAGKIVGHWELDFCL